MKNVAVIFARGGSKGLPNKNIKKLNNYPLISHSIDFAKSCNFINDVFVSTEDKKIMEISSALGAKIIKRPKHLAKDNSPEFLAWKHAVNFLLERNLTFQK